MSLIRSIKLFFKPNANLEPSDKCYDIVKRFEELRLTSYPDQGDVWTIGYGTIIGNGGVAITPGMKITKNQAEVWLVRDLTIARDAVRSIITYPLTQNQFDSLVSFTYNIGKEGLRTSTLARKLNNGDIVSIPYEMSRWVYVKGKISKGLANRRKLEGQLFALKQEK